MSTFEREIRVATALPEVWDFHSRITGLEALTPEWMNLVVEEIRGPDGEFDPEILEAGAEIDLAMRPLGVGPRQSWTTRITEREENEDSAFFRDVMEDGPFARWVHSHYFYADDGGTRIRDRVEYRLPGGELGDLAGPFAVVGFEPMFRYRHRETERLFGR
jgi:ligand-binding SRPBCC domain-containing protein